jgi:hypothetical protein
MSALLDINQRDFLARHQHTFEGFERAAAIVRAEEEALRHVRAALGPVEQAAALISARLRVPPIPDWIVENNIADFQSARFLKELREQEKAALLFGDRFAAGHMTALDLAREAQLVGLSAAVNGSELQQEAERGKKLADMITGATARAQEMERLYKPDFLHTGLTETAFERAIAESRSASKLFDVATESKFNRTWKVDVPNPVRLELPPNPLFETNRRLIESNRDLKAVARQSAASAEGISKLGKVASELTAVTAQGRIENDRSSKISIRIALAALVVAVLTPVVQSLIQADDGRSRARTESQIEQLRASQTRAGEEATALRAENARLSGEIKALQQLKQTAPTPDRAVKDGSSKR